jgi:two-component system, NarL family, sensor histidine kinase NreB
MQPRFDDVSFQEYALNQSSIVAITDARGIITYVNDKFCEISGYSREELLGQNHRLLNSGLHPDSFFREMYQTISRGGVWRGEIRNRRKDGLFYWVDTTIVPALGLNGKPERYVAIRNDITERKRIETSLSFQKYALDQSSIVAITDARGIITYVNDKFCEISGYTREELLGQNHRILNSGLHPDSFFRVMYQTISRGRVWHGEIRNRRKDGSFYWVATTIVPALGPNNKPERYVAIRNDITARKQIEEDLRKRIEAQKKAEDAILQLNLELERKVQERTAQLVQQSNRLRLLADRLTVTEQIERKRLAALIHDHLQQILVAGKFRLEELLRSLKRGQQEEALRKLAQTEDLLKEAIRSAKTLTAELRPPVLYEGGLIAAIQWLVNKYREEHRLETILDIAEVPALDDNLNLLIFELIRELLFNVIKHARTPIAHVRLRPAPSGELHICVEDHGAGFETTGREERFSGGFGLFHIRERLRLINAVLQVHSVPGEGTRIEVFLPLRQERFAAVPVSLANELSTTGPVRENTVNILMVDDHRIVREGIVNILSEQEGFEVIAQAENGLDAVELARILLPDVIVMDVNMPKLNGIEATRIIKAELPNIRIIGLSVQDEPEAVEAMKASGAETLLNKAADPQEFIDVIRHGSPPEAGCRRRPE